MNKGVERNQGLPGWKSVEEIRGGQKGFGFALMGRRGATERNRERVGEGNGGRAGGTRRYSLRLRGRQRKEREFGAVDRAPNLKGLRGLAVRQDAVPLCRNADGTRERNKGRVKQRETERGERRTAAHYYTQLPTPPGFRNSGAQTKLCATNSESFNLLRIERGHSSTRA